MLGDVENVSTCYSKNHQGSRENAPRLRFARHDPSTQTQMDRAPRKGDKLLDVSQSRRSWKTQALFIKKPLELEGERPQALIVTERRPPSWPRAGHCSWTGTGTPGVELGHLEVLVPCP